MNDSGKVMYFWVGYYEEDGHIFFKFDGLPDEKPYLYLTGPYECVGFSFWELKDNAEIPIYAFDPDTLAAYDWNVISQKKKYWYKTETFLVDEDTTSVFPVGYVYMEDK